MASDETLGEVSRRLDRFERRHAQEMAAAESRCSARASTHVDSTLYAAEKNHTANQLADVKSDLTQHIADATAQFKALDERLRWAWRAAITGIAFPVIVGIVLLVITTTRSGGGGGG